MRRGMVEAMPSPFPGMDPYLERADLWPNVHNSLMAALRDDLAPRLRPRYFVGLEERAVLAVADDAAIGTRPDLAVGETAPEAGALHEAGLIYEVPVAVTVLLPDYVRLGYLELRTAADDRIVTVVELLSPFNKRSGEGWDDYTRKRGQVLASAVHLVEIDLLRAGQRMALARPVAQADYRILVSAWETRPRADLYAFDVTSPIPSFPLPLLPDDMPARVDLGAILHAVYDRAGFDLRLDYRRDAEPPLRPQAAAWADALLRAAGLR